MKIKKLAISAMFGIAIIFTIYGFSEGYRNYEEIQVRSLKLL